MVDLAVSEGGQGGEDGVHGTAEESIGEQTCRPERALVVRFALDRHLVSVPWQSTFRRPEE